MRSKNMPERSASLDTSFTKIPSVAIFNILKIGPKFNELLYSVLQSKDSTLLQITLGKIIRHVERGDTLKTTKRFSTQTLHIPPVSPT
mmetsp:Transcript_20544/g.44592  ORF Transcript_20544/g.44592 Transcript_20544/m.44592 type:complete len:88 (+) Transcript_20544:68-331(+)